MSAAFVSALPMLINASRADAAVPALAADPVLSGRAQQRAETLCANRQFSHDGYQAASRGSLRLLDHGGAVRRVALGSRRESHYGHWTPSRGPGFRAFLAGHCPY